MKFVLYVQTNIYIKKFNRKQLDTLIHHQLFCEKMKFRKVNLVRKSVYFEHDPDGNIHPKPF